MRLFYANGGADCYIVSVGSYEDKIDAAQLNDPTGGGLTALEKHLEQRRFVKLAGYNSGMKHRQFF